MEIIRNIKSIPRWVPKSLHNCPFVCALFVAGAFPEAANVATEAAAAGKKKERNKSFLSLLSVFGVI